MCADKGGEGPGVPDVVQTCRLDLPEVILNYPSLPVILQHLKGGLLILHLSKGVFIHNGVIARVLEDARRYPRLSRIE